MPTLEEKLAALEQEFADQRLLRERDQKIETIKQLLKERLVPPAKLHAAALALVDGEHLVADDTGKLAFAIGDKEFKLGDGVSGWLLHGDGRAFLPEPEPESLRRVAETFSGRKLTAVEAVAELTRGVVPEPNGEKPQSKQEALDSLCAGNGLRRPCHSAEDLYQRHLADQFAFERDAEAQKLASIREKLERNRAEAEAAYQREQGRREAELKASRRDAAARVLREQMGIESNE